MHFVTAAEIFDDPEVLVAIDPRAHSERRDQAIGAAQSVTLFVEYTMCGNNICRIIGAKARRRKRQLIRLQAGARSQT